MAVATLSRIRAPAQSPARIAVPTLATVGEIAKRIAGLDHAVRLLSDDRFDAGSARLLAERDRLLDRLGITPARTLPELRTKLRLALAEMRDGNHDEAGDLLDAALADLDRLDGS